MLLFIHENGNFKYEPHYDLYRYVVKCDKNNFGDNGYILAIFHEGKSVLIV